MSKDRKKDKAEKAWSSDKAEQWFLRALKIKQDANPGIDSVHIFFFFCADDV